MNLRLVDDETEKVVHEERQRDAECDDDEDDPYDRLKQHIADVEGVDELVLLQGALLSLDSAATARRARRRSPGVRTVPRGERRLELPKSTPWRTRGF